AGPVRCGADPDGVRDVARPLLGGARIPGAARPADALGRTRTGPGDDGAPGDRAPPRPRRRRDTVLLHGQGDGPNPDATTAAARIGISARSSALFGANGRAGP